MNQPVVIFGMAHSGTTIFARILSQHPDLVLYANGPQRKLLECDEPRYKQYKKLQKLSESLSKRLLVKRPWTEKNYNGWRRHFPKATYFLLLREREASIKSWLAPTSMAGNELKTREVCEAKYSEHLELANKWEKGLLPEAKFMLIRYEQMMSDPLPVWQRVGELLGRPHKFDLSELGTCDIKRVLGQRR